MRRNNGVVPLSPDTLFVLKDSRVLRNRLTLNLMSTSLLETSGAIEGSMYASEPFCCDCFLPCRSLFEGLVEKF